MTTKARKRETAVERDERIVREAGPWEVNGGETCVWPTNPDKFADHYMLDLHAAARVLNRIAKRREK